MANVAIKWNYQILGHPVPSSEKKNKYIKNWNKTETRNKSKTKKEAIKKTATI